MKLLSGSILLAFVFCLCLPLSATAQGEGSPPPLRKVTLYNHGVGYFERQGRINGDQQITFLFDAAQINDVLKSLVVLDLGKGTVKGVTFDTTKPVERQLEEFGISLDSTNRTGLTTLLGQFKGARVEVRVGNATVNGVVVGIEKFLKLQGNEKAEVQELVLIGESGELRSLGFDQIRDIKILDAKLREDLNQYLSILRSTFHKNLRPLTISADGQGERDLFISYVVESPVWKTTYRLVLDRAAKPFLQGWALIDNLQDEDWNNITLSLISGAPISFIQDLQQPIYRNRPVVELPQHVALAPSILEPAMGHSSAGGDAAYGAIKLVSPSRGGTIGGTVTDSSGAAISNATVRVIQPSANAQLVVNTDANGVYRIRALPPGRYTLSVESSGFKTMRIEGLSIAAGRNIDREIELEVGTVSEAVTITSNTAALATEMATVGRIRDGNSGVEVNVETQDIGELFEYRIAHPVTIRRNSSALIPILQNRIEGEQVSLYNREVRAENPMSAFYLKNTTGLTLESGPMTVIENETYAGEALLGRLKPGEKRFVTYAVDLGCRVGIKEDEEDQRAFLAQVINGEFRIHYQQVKSTIYTLDNVSDRPKIVYLEHPYEKDEKWQLVKTPKPDETTGSFYRFKVAVAPHSSTAFSVYEELPEIETHAISNLTPGNMEVFIKANYLSPQLRQALNEIIETKARIAAIGRQIAEKQAENTAIGRDQERMRENLRALGKTDDEKQLVQRYVSRLSQGEDQIERLRQEEKNLREQKQGVENQLEERIRNLKLDYQIN